MATSSMASAVAGFLFTPNVIENSSSVSRPNMLSFPLRSNSSRFVVKAAEEAMVPAPTSTIELAEGPEAPPKPKPALIGPKRGAEVKILRRESYWYKLIGFVVVVDQGLWL